MKYHKAKKPSGRSKMELNKKCKGWCNKNIPVNRWLFGERLCLACEVQHKSGKSLPQGRRLHSTD